MAVPTLSEITRAAVAGGLNGSDVWDCFDAAFGSGHYTHVLRDGFAKAAMAAYITTPKKIDNGEPLGEAEFAELAYLMADAMMAARKVA